MDEAILHHTWLCLRSDPDAVFLYNKNYSSSSECQDDDCVFVNKKTEIENSASLVYNYELNQVFKASNFVTGIPL